MSFPFTAEPRARGSSGEGLGRLLRAEGRPGAPPFSSRRARVLDEDGGDARALAVRKVVTGELRARAVRVLAAEGQVDHLVALGREGERAKNDCHGGGPVHPFPRLGADRHSQRQKRASAIG